MSPNVAAFDEWIRGPFAALNTELEECYFAQTDRDNVAGVGTERKHQLQNDGRRFVLALLEEGNTDEGFDAGFDLLGNVGLFMAACGRHAVADDAGNEPMRETWALAMQLGASLGVTPRFATSHLTTHNQAVDGRPKRFTQLPDELLFNDYNTRGIFAYKRAADALLRVMGIGVINPVAFDLLRDARDALYAVADYNQRLFDELDVDRFFYSVRPYFRPHRVGLQIYRGANAGDFAGINVIDLLTGLCRANNPSYSQLLVEKFLYMMPEDQAILRDCMRRESLMEALLRVDASTNHSVDYQANLSMFLQVCSAHGRAATQHHDQLVNRFIAHPAQVAGVEDNSNLTASGPPLGVMLASLEKLRDLRCGADRKDIPSRFADIQSLKARLK